MIAVYLETSAVLAWLLGEKAADRVREAIDGAEAVVTSSLMSVETERAIVRAESNDLLRAGDGQRLRGAFQRAQARWARMAISEEVLSRASRPFPVEPVRTLDAIHLSTALIFAKVFPELRVLSFDRRILDNAEALGIGPTATSTP